MKSISLSEAEGICGETEYFGFEMRQFLSCDVMNKNAGLFTKTSDIL